MKRLISLTVAAFVVAVIVQFVSAGTEEGWVKLFNGKDLAGWKMRDGKTNATWKVVSEVKADPADPAKLIGTGNEGVLLRLAVENGVDVVTEKTFGDCELHIEFMNAKGGNSGIYFMGLYELQACDSFGLPDNKMDGECGAIMWTKAPSSNACKAPGQWQSYEVVFRAPRFDASGKKTENARFVSVILNGKKVHENTEVKEPTGGGFDEQGEKAMGPLYLQGNEGVAAFRNVKIRAVELK